MNLISQHIEYLIRYNDCVIVPGWGAFIAQYQPASLVNNQLTPPSRGIAFNPSLTHDDGILASSIVRQTGIGYDVAIKKISDGVNSLRHQLDASGEVALPKVGIFTRNNEGTMLFEPFNTSSFIAPFYGLPLVKVTPMLTQARIEAESESSDGGKKDTIYIPIRRSWTRIAASIALILGLGFTLSTPIINDQANQASMISTPVQPKVEIINPTNNSPLVLNVSSTTSDSVVIDTLQRKQYQAVMAYYKQREEQRKARQEAMQKQLEEFKKQQEEKIAAQKDANSKNSISQQASQQNSKKANTQLHINDSDQYCVVIASLTSKAQAERFIASTGNGSLRILEKDGKYRVYAATGSTYSEAHSIALRNGLLNRYNGTWICRR